MEWENNVLIQREFTKQAYGFESSRMNFSKQAYLDHIVSKIAPTANDAVLEVAAGTCACGRAIAPHAGSVTCLDMTPAMLAVGKTAAEQANLDNMTFVLGDAAELPFLNNSFDIVLSRLAFHHFPEVRQPFAEMVRVLKPDGKLVLIDMEAAEEPLRETEDRIEQLRDPSHVRNLSREEMLALYEQHGLTVQCCEATSIPVDVQSWLELTKTPQQVQEQILKCFAEERNGGQKTGFAPYQDGTTIKFNQRWMLLIGNKA